MNYYSFHVGDYASHTRHLTLIGDLAYRRLIDLYYLTERPLPADPAECARRIGMREQIQEVTEVLSDFFVKSDAGWINKRCEQEINKYHAKETLGSERRATETERQRRHRERRAELFQKLRDHGVTMPFDTVTSDLVTELSRVTGALRNGLDTAITKNQEPITNNQEEKPPLTPKGELPVGEKPEKSITLKTYLDDCEKGGKAPIPEDDAVWKHADATGLPDEFLHLAWAKFERQYLQNGKRQKGERGWRQTFRNAVEGNWFKLWYLNGSGWALTTAGQQTKLEAEHG